MTRKTTTKGEAFIINPLEYNSLKHEGKTHKIHPSDLMFLYESHPIVYAVINQISDSVIGDGYFFVKNQEEVKDNNTEEIKKIFSGSQGDQSLKLTMKQIVKDVLTTGDSYMEKVAFNPRVVRLDRISPRYMRKRVTKTGELIGYGQWIAGKWMITWDKEEVFSEGLNNGDVYGIPPLQASYQEVLTDLGAIMFNKKFFENDASPLMFWKLKEDIGMKSREEKELIRKQLLASYQGAVNSSKPLINTVVEEVKVIERDLNKLQFSESRDKFIEKLCSAYNMSKSIIGFTDTANEATASQTMRKQFYNSAVKPMEMMIERFINDEILPVLGFGEYSIKIRERDFDNMEDKVKTITELRKTGLMTENEARIALDLPRIEEEWADQYSVLTATGYVPATDMQDMNEEQTGLVKSLARIIKRK